MQEHHMTFGETLNDNRRKLTVSRSSVDTAADSKTNTKQNNKTSSYLLVDDTIMEDENEQYTSR